MKPKEHTTTERIILSVEIVQDGKDTRCSMRVPYANFFESEDASLWLENAVQEMRTECKLTLNELKENDSVRSELNAAAQEFMEGMASNE